MVYAIILTFRKNCLVNFEQKREFFNTWEKVGYCHDTLKFVSSFWMMSEVFGGSLKFLSSVLFNRTPKTLFYGIFKWQFMGCVVLWDQIFLEKSATNSKHFRKFSQKSIFYASNSSLTNSNVLLPTHKYCKQYPLPYTRN